MARIWKTGVLQHLQHTRLALLGLHDFLDEGDLPQQLTG